MSEISEELRNFGVASLIEFFSEIADRVLFASML
jgi:hypothetical protein